jgi:hypothetical protein
MTSSTSWFKSSYSNGEGGACLEVSPSFPGVVPVRDSKIADSPVLVVSHAGWVSLVAGVKASADR